ncbi:MAG: NHL domain-containing protein [Bacteroidia bacterium]
MKKTILTLSALAFFALANAQTVNTEAGTKGNAGFNPYSGSPLTVPFNQPFGIAVDGSDRLFISDAQNHRVSLLIPGDQVVAKTGYLLDPSLGGGTYINATGSNARYNQPKGMVFGPDGKLYVCDFMNNAIRVMNGITTIGEAQQVTTFVGEDPGVNSGGDYVDGTGNAARFNGPVDIAVDGNGNFYVADNWNEVIRKITPGGVVTTFAGAVGQTGDVNGIGTNARFNNILALEMLDNTYLLVADSYNNKIKKININTGVVTTYAGSGATGHTDSTSSLAEFDSPSGLAVDAFGNVYVSEGGSSQSNVIRKIDGNGNVTTICGAYQNTTEYADGQGTASRFYQPVLMAFNNAKNILYVCDAGNNTVRSIDLRPKARLVATPTSTNTGVNVQLTSQSLNTPTSWTWALTPSTGFTLENGTTLNSENPILKFNVATTYTVKLTASNAYGSGDTTRANYINISTGNPGNPPVANFIADDSTVLVGVTVSFTDQSTNAPTSWEWTILPNTFAFVNSTSATSQHPKVQFAAQGTYSVSLKATNADGNDTKVKPNYILVDPLGIKPVKLNALINVFPNPNGGSFQVQKIQGFENPDLTFTLYDFSGKLIEQGAFDGESVSFSNLSSGVYLIKVSDGSNEFNQKVVVR